MEGRGKGGSGWGRGRGRGICAVWEERLEGGWLVWAVGVVYIICGYGAFRPATSMPILCLAEKSRVSRGRKIALLARLRVN